MSITFPYDRQFLPMEQDNLKRENEMNLNKPWMNKNCRNCNLNNDYITCMSCKNTR